MFLDKKGIRTILIVTICNLALGGFCVACWALIASLGGEAKLLFVLGLICFAVSPLLALWGRYAEGKGHYINLGNQLVRNELKPAEFIKQYEELKNSPDLIVNRPSIEVLHLVAIAYDTLNDRESCLATVDEMLSVADDKKKTFVKLIKSSFLFSHGMTEEAEALFSEARSEKPDFMCQAYADAILKGDRAMAIGDYKTVEAYCLKMLSQTFPKLDNLGKLVMNYKLGEAYEKMQDTPKAVERYRYCAENGGETAVTKDAGAALERLQ